jgi:succinate-semialdehyde dehydrogenase/glutarate-semialdehyde dehydrogenase
MKKVSMELGGNAPFIVFDDADLDRAVEGTLASKFRNTGQTCICANRVFVQKSVYDDYTRKLCDAVSNLKVGNGLDDGVEQGPLIDDDAVAKVEEHVQDALDKGAEVRVGGKKHRLGGRFYEPSVLTGGKPNMKFMEEETFGPVAILVPFETEEEVIELSNDTPLGLAGYFYSSDHARVWRVAAALEVGMIGINTGAISNAAAPFGGVKESGLGREGSRYGIEEFMEKKYLCLAQ